MSRQDMEFENVHRDGPKSSYGRYEGDPHYDSYATGSYGQKISASASSGPSWGQRLALAIISLILLIVMFVIEVASVQNGPGDFAFTALKVIGVIIVFAIFSTAVIMVNYFFNRKR